jgi:Ca-activated chloride channel family protein
MRRIDLTVPVTALVVFAVASVTPSVAVSQPSTPGCLTVDAGKGELVEMPLRHTSVSTEITAFVARTVIEQTFANPFDRPVEAVYVFPLGDRAAVDDFEFVIGDRTIRGEIRRREEARQVYEQARESGNQAALLEQERPNVFTQSVANLEPGKEVTVRIRTVETLRYEKGLYQFTFPLVVGPRYIPGGKAPVGEVVTGSIQPTPAVPDANRISPPVLRPGFRSGHDVEIEIRIDAGVPIADVLSVSHRIQTELHSTVSAVVRLAPGDTIPNKDFILRWSVSAEKPAVGLLAHRNGVDGFFTLLVQPKGEVSAEEAMPKEIIFVLDTSGSMSGIPIESSKRFIKLALKHLGPRDTFNLIRFAGGAATFSKEPLPNDDRSVQRAFGWIENLRGAGGTEMLAGFRAAFARPADPNRMRIVIFATDGHIGNEHQILAAIGEVVDEARIFALGIGSSVNHYLLDRMAEVGQGAYVFIRPDGREAEAVDHFRSWVTRPYLTDIEIDWGALPVADMVPEKPGDLFSGQTLTVVGRYLGAGEGDVVVRGRLGGRYWEQTQHVVLPDRNTPHEALASLWARHRIAKLMLESPGNVPPSIEAEVTSLALEFRLMSKYTSFVAVDDSRVVNPTGESETIHQALPVPEGVSFEGVFGAAGPRSMIVSGEEGQEAPEIVPEDRVLCPLGGDIRNVLKVSGARKRDFKAVVSGGVSNVDPLMDPGASDADGEGDPDVHVGGVITGGAPGVEYAHANGGYERVGAEREIIATEMVQVASLKRPAAASTEFSEEFRSDLPVRGRFYSNVITLAPGVQDEEPGHNPTAAVRLLNASFRVLADLAEDGRLSSAEGRPALAALLAAQTPEGAIAHDVKVHAVATWAIAEASVRMRDDPWVNEARKKATTYLRGLAVDGGWPAEPGGEADADASRWALMVLEWLLGDEAPRITVTDGEVSAEYASLRKALASARAGEIAGGCLRPAPFDRLIAAIGRGHLRLAG